MMIIGLCRVNDNRTRQHPVELPAGHFFIIMNQHPRTIVGIFRTTKYFGHTDASFCDFQFP